MSLGKLPAVAAKAGFDVPGGSTKGAVSDGCTQMLREDIRGGSEVEAAVFVGDCFVVECNGRRGATHRG